MHTKVSNFTSKIQTMKGRDVGGSQTPRQENLKKTLLKGLPGLNRSLRQSVRSSLSIHPCPAGGLYAMKSFCVRIYTPSVRYKPDVRCTRSRDERDANGCQWNLDLGMLPRDLGYMCTLRYSALSLRINSMSMNPSFHMPSCSD